MKKLSLYQKKRKFDETSEPKPRLKKSTGKALIFCVQRHNARRLHFDLRLELDGVLLSWAVPKGPSMDPADKRLAIHVEDHPLEYAHFEGTIPAGNYGAGTVEIWDEGTYLAEAQAMRDGLKKGHLHFELQGKKLKGAFDLIKIKDEDGKAWLLIKAKDEAVKKKLIKKSPMPKWVDPMLATLGDKAFDDDDWLFEIKWDGYRALAFIDGDKVGLWSRNHKSFKEQFPAVFLELKKLHSRVILDGEIVVLDEEGLSHFQLLQSCFENPSCNVHYMVFDMLFYEGQDLRNLTLPERKQYLQEFLSTQRLQRIHYADHVEEEGKAFFQAAQTRGLEGIIAKRKDSTYVSVRSPDWVKIKTHKGQEMVIAGFTPGRGAREYFRSLILGSYEKGVLEFRGHVGTGFSQKNLAEVYKKMKPLIQAHCPFATKPKTNGPATWIKPVLVAEINFREITKDGSLRQPVFKGLREDKEAREAKVEVPTALSAKSQEFSNLDKIYWPKEHYTKGDMLLFYEVVAPFMVEHLKGRPVMLRRFPDGIEGMTFYQKNIEKPPPWLSTVVIEHPHGKKKQDRHPIIDDTKSLLYLANLGTIEFHPMLSSVEDLECPNFMAIDLDPEALDFSKVVEVAKEAHRLLDDLELANYCKTSGGRGLHLYVPLGKEVLYEQSLALAELVAHVLKSKMPSLVSLERMPQRRQKKVYIDFLQNVKGKSMIAPYSLRARPHAPVSTPIKWSELKSTLDPAKFTMATLPKRLEKLGDIFAPVLSESINFEEVVVRLERYLANQGKK